MGQQNRISLSGSRVRSRALHHVRLVREVIWSDLSVKSVIVNHRIVSLSCVDRPCRRIFNWRE